MQKNAVSAVFAGAMMATAVSLPNQASGMTLGPSFGVLSAAPTTQFEQAGWCDRRGCLGRP
jgi:hypothetical protein